MFFAKGEIIMNNIYKVIWSKAKNCYVVASEIARSHTKSATGSGKIGGVTRRPLLASLMALSLLCGGLGVASAADGTVRVDVSEAGTAAEVYTKDGTESYVQTKLNDYAKADNTYTQGQVRKLINDLSTGDVTTNRDNITTLKGKTAGLSADGKSLTDMNSVETGALKVTGNISNGTETTTLAAIDASMKQTDTNKEDIANLQTKTNTQQAWIGKLKDRTTKITHDATGTSVDGVTFNAGAVTGVKSINGIDIGDMQVDMNGKKLTDVGTINGIDIGDTQVDMNGKNLTNVGTINGINLGEKEGGNYISQDGSIWGNMKKVDTQVGTNTTAIAQEKTDREKAIGNLTEDKNYIKKDKNVSDNLVELDKQAKTNADAITETNQRTHGITRDDSRNETSIEGRVTVDTNGNIKAEGTITSNGLNAGDGDIKTNGTVSAGNVSTGTLETTGDATIGRDLTVKGILNTKDVKAETIHVSKSEDTPDHTSKGSIIGEGGHLSVSNEKFDKRNNITKESQLNVNEEGTVNWATSTDATGNKTEGRSEVTADNIKNSVKKTEGGKTFGYEENITAGGKGGTVTDKAGNTTYTKVTATENSFQVQDKDGKNKNHQVNTKDSSVTEITNGDGKTTKTEQTATDITNTAKDGTITNDANHIVNNANTMDTTVTGKATESYGELDTTVKGNETHTVTGNQTNKIDRDQENTIGGNQTTTVTGNVKEDYKKDLATTVGGNENHEVKGTKTETVEGKVTENFKNGQATNVTGNQDIKVSGTQTTTATDIKRNASGGMIDTIDNDYGTNTETKVAGKTTTDVSIKGTGEEGKYIRGANESRDYLIKGTLKNSETKTVDATSTEITDGKGKTSATIQDKTQISGSVTNGTSSAVSNVKADSIDTAVKEGTNTSLISQKKDSITSAVGNGTTSTVIQQGDKDITIASNGGTVGIVGKDIINNATNEITNTAGTKITDKVGNNTRVIDQTSITDTVGTASRKIEDGKITDTAGDSTVTTENGKGTTFAKAGSAAYSTEAGATKDTNIAGNHITTGRVDANELGVSDKDDQGNTADLSVKAGEGIKSSATDKDGNTTYTKVTATENSFQVQDKDGNIKNHQVNTKDKSENTITNGDKTNIVTSTADGTTFNNSKANIAFEGGTYTDTTIKGNTITTGKVTMDYAEVMKDLGVHGNAKVDQNLEVGGTSTLNGDVTMESNATVNGNFSVGGNTNLKNTEVDGTLNVTQKATFGDSVSIAKDLSVGGDVTANSYKVGDKTYIDKNGIHANGQKITNVADGSISEGSKDAVNGGQLYDVKRDMEHKVDKVGANAAAMANLRPMEFDPSSKWNIAAAIGNYGSETAAALGAFYRPNDDVMVNLSTAFGTGENMVGGGVSVRLGKGSNKLSREETNALKAQVADLTARMDALLSVLNPNMSKDFPDVPENHWAYEAVSRLAGNDIVQGYPDGEFHGERTMTRYEMAEIIYNALSRGAEAEKELVEEFKPELQAMAASEKATAERAEG